jgi:hypothetical protein
MKTKVFIRLYNEKGEPVTLGWDKRWPLPNNGDTVRVMGCGPAKVTHKVFEVGATAVITIWTK